MNRGSWAAKVLVVEDDTVLANLLGRYLANQGAEVEVVNTAEEALEAISREKFDVLVADMVLPGMRGEELAARLRESGAGARVILMTGYPLDRHDPVLQGPDVDRILQKPCDLKQLAEAVRELAGRRCREKREQ
jgi:DNA-binding response OmpR family regulator